MGTRSLTYVYDDYSVNTPIMCMYRQYDGYPTGHGAELSEFLHDGKLVNGIPFGSTGKMFNGMGCLAAQLVAHFKNEVGGFYLYPPVLGQSCGQEYEYHIRKDEIKILDGDAAILFMGTWEEFAEFCEAYA